VVRTNEDYGVGNCVVLPDPDATALATFEAVELQALTFFASRSFVCAGGFTEVDPPICFRCLCWNLTGHFCSVTATVGLAVGTAVTSSTRGAET
jgi:hypothetical protein